MIFQPKPSIISRSSWGSRTDTRVGTNRHGTRYIVIHHCAYNNSTIAARSEYEHMRVIQNQHMNDQGWSDIAYHYGIGKNGTIMEGRLFQYLSYASNTSPTYVDNNGIQVLMHGNFHVGNHFMNTSQRSKLIDLLSWLCYQYNISPSNIIGHRDNGASACPGDQIYSELTNIKNEVTMRVYGVQID